MARPEEQKIIARFCDLGKHIGEIKKNQFKSVDYYEQLYAQLLKDDAVYIPSAKLGNR